MMQLIETPAPVAKGQAQAAHDCGIQEIFHACECGRTHRLNVGWHDRRWLRCNRHVWAIRPTRAITLVIRPWPGDWKSGFLDHEQQIESENQLTELEKEV